LIKLVAEAEPQADLVAELELETEMVEVHQEIQDQVAEAETMVSQLADQVDLELHG
jgi:replicative DNA helicase